MKRILKNIICVAITLMFCFMACNVKAYTLTAQDIVDFINQTGNLGSDEKLVANGNTIKYYVNDELDSSYDINKDYIEFSSENPEDSDNDIYRLIFFAFYEHVEGLFQSFILEDGEESGPMSMLAADDAYNKYGMYIKNYTDQNNQRQTHCKFSLDQDKLNETFMKKFKFREDLSDERRAFLTITPEMSVEDLKKTEVKIFPTNTNATVYSGINYCYIYRSNTPDGEYVKITDKKVKCNGEYGVLDNTLSPGETYYYKARMVFTNVLSEPLEVTTLAGSTTTTKKTEIEESTTSTEKAAPDNPKTGVSSHIIITSIVVMMGIVAMALLRKNKTFRQI